VRPHSPHLGNTLRGVRLRDATSCCPALNHALLAWQHTRQRLEEFSYGRCSNAVRLLVTSSGIHANGTLEIQPVSREELVHALPSPSSLSVAWSRVVFTGLFWNWRRTWHLLDNTPFKAVSSQKSKLIPENFSPLCFLR